MDVRAQPGVIGQVPTVMVRIVVDHDLVAIPEPAVAEVIFERGDLKVEAVEPEALHAPSPEPEDMAAPDAAREASMLPGMIEVIVRIGGAGIMSDPGVVVCMDVRGIRMRRLVAKSAILDALRRAATAAILAALRSTSTAAISGDRGRTMSGNVPTAHRTPATLLAAGFLLGKSRNRKDQQESKKPG